MVHIRLGTSIRPGWRTSLLVGCLVVAPFSASAAHAQEVTPDFATQMQTTLPSNEQLVGQIGAALPADDLIVISDEAGLTTGVGEDLVDQLTFALALAPDDASRSRIEGVLTHTQAALASLRLAQAGTTLDSARASLDAARGEAEEALSELRPFVLALVASGAITGK
jgi:hypothetical protein